MENPSWKIRISSNSLVLNYHLARNRKGEANQMMHGGDYNLDAGFLAVFNTNEEEKACGGFN